MDIYILYKSLTYGYLYDLSQLGRYFDSHLKVVKTRGHISTQVQGSCTSCT